MGFDIDIKTDQNGVDFLAITFSLRNGTYKPYTKPNNKPLNTHIN